jgi:hypothetical protein
MGFFDNLKNSAVSSLKNSTTQAVNSAAGNAFYNATGGNKDGVGKGKNSSQTFTFSSIPNSVAELQSLPEASLDSPFKTTALVLLVLCNYERSLIEKTETTHEMLNFLKGPEDLSGYEKSFIKERLTGKYYKPFSYFAGATVENGYTPSEPFTITVYENPYSFDNENWAIMWVKSSGADTERQVKLRRKPSTNQWFLNEILCLSDIRIPAAEDPWA